MKRAISLLLAILIAFACYAVAILAGLPHLAVLAVVALWAIREVALRQRNGSSLRGRRLISYLLGQQRGIHFSVRAILLLYAVARIWDSSSPQFLLVALVLMLRLLSLSYLPSLFNRAYPIRLAATGLESYSFFIGTWRWFDTTSSPFRNFRRTFNRSQHLVEPLIFTMIAMSFSATLSVVVLIAAAATYTSSALLTIVTAARMTLTQALAQHSAILKDAVADFGPQILIYFSASSKREVYQIREWINPITGVGFKTLILTRERNLVEALTALAEPIPVLFIQPLGDLDKLVPKSVRVALYVNNGMKNAHLLRHRAIQHVQLLHGESDKSASSSKFTRAYDKICVAGPLAVDRYRAWGISIPDEQFEIIGRPSTDAYSKCDIAAADPVVLYAPTWEGVEAGVETSSILTHGKLVVETIFEKFPECSLLFRPHPLAGTRSAEFRNMIRVVAGLIEQANAREGLSRHRLVDPDNESLAESFNESSILVTDVSSLIVEYLATGKPALICDVERLGREQFLLEYPTANGFYVVPSDSEEIAACVDLALNADPLRIDRLRNRAYVLGDFEGSATERLQDLLGELVSGEETRNPVTK